MPRSISNLQKYLKSLTFDTRGQRFNTNESLNEHVELKEKNIPRKHYSVCDLRFQIFKDDAIRYRTDNKTRENK